MLAPAAAVVGLPPTDVRLLPDQPAAMAHELYAALRALDRAGVDVIVAVLPPEAGLGAAVGDRLRRAAGPRATTPERDDDPDGESP